MHSLFKPSLQHLLMIRTMNIHLPIHFRLTGREHFIGLFSLHLNYLLACLYLYRTLNFNVWSSRALATRVSCVATLFGSPVLRGYQDPSSPQATPESWARDVAPGQ